MKSKEAKKITNSDQLRLLHKRSRKSTPVSEEESIELLSDLSDGSDSEDDEDEDSITGPNPKKGKQDGEDEHGAKQRMQDDDGNRGVRTRRKGDKK